jgi:hypothetical protein
MIPKRYPETLKIAAMSEINRMLTRSGVSGQVQSLLSHGKKFVSCMKSCMVRFPLLNTKINLWISRTNAQVDARNVSAVDWTFPQTRLWFKTQRVVQLARDSIPRAFSNYVNVLPELELTSWPRFAPDSKFLRFTLWYLCVWKNKASPTTNKVSMTTNFCVICLFARPLQRYYN